jgi:cytochrome c-type biogenesis protein CcsB
LAKIRNYLINKKYEPIGFSLLNRRSNFDFVVSLPSQKHTTAMLNKLAKAIFSTRTTGLLFIAFAVAMAVGTFIDAGQGASPTPMSRRLIYNAWWFEGIMLLFVVNFIGNIFKYKLLRKEKWATLTLHLSFILILLGAFVTRYTGFEGMMAIREGETEQMFLSDKTYVTVLIDGDFMIDGLPQRRVAEYPVDFSSRLDNSFEEKTDYNKQDVSIELKDFIAGAEIDVVPNDQGERYLKVVEAGSAGPHNHFLKDGDIQSIHGILYAFNNNTPGAINIFEENDNLFIQSPFDGEFMTMATGTQGTVVKDSIQPLVLRSRYIIGDQAVVFPKPVVKGVFDVVKKSQLLKGDKDAIVLDVSSNGQTKTIKLLGGKGTNEAFEQFDLAGLKFSMRYGSKVYELPFQIKLNDFVAEKYPGTEQRYSEFSSAVTVIDPVEGEFDYRIYMNHILDHQGYRFFQSSFDPDEKGTILSVNHDFWGTWITYMGYFLLYFGLMAILFSRFTRFNELKKQLEKLKKLKSKLAVVGFVLMSATGLAQENAHEHNMANKHIIDSILAKNITPKSEADYFGRLVIQDLGGRMMPINTYASELLRKLSKDDSYEDADANQVFLSMQESPLLWYSVPIIYLSKKKADTIRSIIGIPKQHKYATLADFFTEQGAYKLAPYLEEAYKAQQPSAIQKQFKEADERVNLLFNTLEQDYLKIFPLPDDPNNKWVSPNEFRNEGLVIEDSLYANFINTGFQAYLFVLQQDKQTSNFEQSRTLLDAIKTTQSNLGKNVMLSDKKIDTEIAYNRYDIFKNLFSWYMYAGTLLFVVVLIQLFKDRGRIWRLLSQALSISIYGLLVLHTAGLAVRWYISGHAPWSDAYESMIYVAWATMAFGAVFGYHSKLTLASTAFVTAMILMIAHWNWMDPAIANLQPVLNSYWLMIHVAVIVASYGPFTLGMILGLVSLILMIFTNQSNKEQFKLHVKELTAINEMSLTVGLVMLTIGNFLGGMWANESWGRYWGWDPKETWALISIMIYAFVLHMRLIPGLGGRLGYNLASIVAFGSIMMTYFGVNFYLSGLHSYASGDQIVSAQFILITAAIIVVVGVLAQNKYKRFYR